jgi:hypothetical protein
VYITSVYDNPYEHSREDTVDKINLEALRQAGDAISAAIVELANASPK